MATITEDYCSYEVAKLLKEKGFDEPCYMSYWLRTKDSIEFVHLEQSGNNFSDCIYAPTHQMAMAWLREEKNIIVNVWYNGVDWSAEYYNNEDEIFYLITDYSCNSYEEAVEAALKYVLENLI